MKRLCVLLLLLSACSSKQRLTIEKSVEYGASYDFSPELLDVAWQDVDAVIYESVELDHLGEYVVLYQDGKNEVELKLSVVDTTLPQIGGVESIQIAVSQIEQLPQLLGLWAWDNVDGDLTQQLVCDEIDGSGSYEWGCSVKDSSGNEEKMVFDVKVIDDSLVNQGDWIVYGSGIVDGLSITPTIIENPDDIGAVVNKFYALPDDYAPIDLVSLSSDSTKLLRKEAAEAYERLNQAALAQGLNIYVLSAYRTKDYQANLFNNYINQNGAEFAAVYSAVPRRSEHELGLAVDFGNTYVLDDAFDQTAEGSWLKEHAHEYGFILRYPADRILDTQYGFEPWHYRYVGEELATYLYENNLILEDYMK